MTQQRRSTSRAKPTEQLSGRAIQRAVLGQALQHPTTLFPFAAGAVAATFGLCVAPFVGGAPIALLVAGCAGAISAGSFAWRYLVQGETSARTMAQRAIQSEEQRRRDEERHELEGRRSELQRDADQVQWTEGREALDQLADAYDLVQSALDSQHELDPLAQA